MQLDHMIMPPTSKGDSMEKAKRRLWRVFCLMTVLILQCAIIKVAFPVKVLLSTVTEKTIPKENTNVEICEGNTQSPTQAALKSRLDGSRRRCDASSSEPTLSYFCEGPKYDSFVQSLVQYVGDPNSGLFPERYGRSPFPFPAGSTILFFGNSHTRQLGSTLECQYSDQITHSETQLIPQGKRTETKLTQFGNNSTVVTLTNVPIPYSTEWYKLFGRVTGGRFELSDFDAIVLGKFNKHSDSKQTTFAKTVQIFGDAMNISSIDFVHNPPPELNEVARRFSGPIVTVGMFARYSHAFVEKSLQVATTLATEHHRTNVHVIEARKHIEAMGQECGSDVRVGTADCDTGGRPPQDMHRCVGTKGGQVDLIAWELVDELTQMLSA